MLCNVCTSLWRFGLGNLKTKFEWQQSLVRDSKICFSWFKLCQSSFMPRWNFLAQSLGLTLLVDSRCWFECLKYLDGLNRSVNPRLMILNVLERNLRSDKKGPMLKLAWLWFRGLHNFLSAFKPLFCISSLTRSKLHYFNRLIINQNYRLIYF